MHNINISVFNKRGGSIRFNKSIFCKIKTFNKHSSVFFFLNLIDNKLYVKFDYVFYCVNICNNFVLLSELLNIYKLNFFYFSFDTDKSYFLLDSKELNFLVKKNINLVWHVFLDILNFLKKNNFGFKIKLKFLGLGFSIIKLSDNLFKFFLSSSTNIYLFVPNFIRVQYIVDERSIIIFGLEPNNVNNIASIFLLLLNVSTYRLFGIVRLGKIVRLKIGKKR